MKEVKIFKQEDNRTVGIFQDVDGSFLALTFSQSKEFKTLRGAVSFMKKMGYE